MENETLHLNMDEENYIEGDVAAIYFSNPSNFYKVLLLNIEDSNIDYSEPQIVVVGNFGQIQTGDSYEFYGDLTDHPKYGVQFKAERYAKNMPSTEEAVISYLSGPKFKGIGEKTAEKIVDALGVGCIDIILDDPDKLKKVSGLNQSKRDTIAKVVGDEQGMQKVIFALNKYGIANQLAYRIYAYYEKETLDVIQKNPYQLVSDIQGIGFNKADNIAEEMGIASDAPERIQAGILYGITEGSLSNGNTFVSGEVLINSTINVLEQSRSYIIDADLVADNLIIMVENQTVLKDEDRFYLPSLYASEWGIANSIEKIQSRKFKKIDVSDLEDKILDLEDELEITYGPSQKEAIIEGMNSPIFVLTGGPGTGKTTVLNGIVNLFAKVHELSLDPYSYKDQSFPILLAAPTGRAAKRMKETTELPAGTIHRLLGLTADDEDMESSIELSGKLLIVDEMSMLDTWLAYQLFKSIPGDMQVILVGDKDQLPSVGPGQVLRDFIDSDTIEQKELQDIYRQDEASSIIPLAHDIKNNSLPSDFKQAKIDRSFIPCRTDQVIGVIEKVVGRAIEKGYTAEQVQILAPMYRGKAGIDNLNQHLQNLFNPNPHNERKEVKYLDKVYRINDKVLQLVNDPERNVFNGDVGFITGIIPAKESELKTDELVIDFEGNEVNYLRNEWNKITLAYCSSIHKAQGSEYDMVILPMVRSYGRMLKKDLLYTAITRASRFLILLGEEDAYVKSLNQTSMLRKTTLKERLVADQEPSFLDDDFNDEQPNENTATNKEKIKSSEGHTLSEKLVKQNEIDPMIGMEGITPYS